MANDFTGGPIDWVSDSTSATWGSVRVGIASNVGQGNGGTSIPCREVWVGQGATSVATGSRIMMNVGTAATSILGILLPHGVGVGLSIMTSVQVQPQPMRLPIDDVSNLYFWSEEDAPKAVVDILYRK